MNFKPLHDKIVVKRAPVEEKTAGGLFLPDTSKNLEQKGTVVAVGTGRVLPNGNIYPLDVEVGNTVVFSKYGGTEIMVDSEEYLILIESDIIAILT